MDKSKVFFTKEISEEKVVDLVYNSTDPGRDHLVERIESRNGVHTIDSAAILEIGSKEYELIEV